MAFTSFSKLLEDDFIPSESDFDQTYFRRDEGEGENAEGDHEAYATLLPTSSLDAPTVTNMTPQFVTRDSTYKERSENILDDSTAHDMPSSPSLAPTPPDATHCGVVSHLNLPDPTAVPSLSAITSSGLMPPSGTMIMQTFDTAGECFYVEYIELPNGDAQCMKCFVSYKNLPGRTSAALGRLRRHYEEKHLARNEYICILCGQAKTRRHTVKKHFPSCVKAKGNPNNHNWDDHPTCQPNPRKRGPVAGDALIKQRRYLAQYARSSTTSGAQNRVESPCPPTEPSTEAYSHVKPDHQQKLVSMALGRAFRAIKEGKCDAEKLNNGLRHFVSLFEDDGTLGKMDDYVKGITQSARRSAEPNDRVKDDARADKHEDENMEDEASVVEQEGGDSDDELIF